MSKFFKTMSVNISDVEKDCSPLITIILVCIFYFLKKLPIEYSLMLIMYYLVVNYHLDVTTK